MTFTLGWPQGILLALMMGGVIAATVDHGKPRKPMNAYVTFVSFLIEAALLVWGGFFS